MKLQEKGSVERVVRLETSQVDGLAIALSRACYDEPNFVHTIPGQERRRRVLPRFFRSAIRISQIYGEIYIAEGAESCALWISPENEVTFGRMVRGGIRAPHWYLMALGVGRSVREAQARQRAASIDEEAVSTALLEPVLARADSTGMSCYLETFSERRLRFFGTHGFRIMGAGRIAASGPEFWTMIRPPRGAR